jgi:signal transduction histidine kinase
LNAGGRIRGLRGRLLLVVLGVVLVGVLLLVAGFNVVLRARLDADVNDLLSGRASAQLATLSSAGGRLEVGEAPDDAAVDSQVWVFAGGRQLEHPRAAAASVDRAASRLADVTARRTVDVASPETRLLAVPVRRDGRRLGTVVVAVSLAPYERTERVALAASLVLAAITVLAVGLVARWLLGAALRPVARMTADAAAWSETDLDRRFGLGPPTDELTRLAATLDGLLDRLAAGLRRERRLSAELSHELRTPLAKISTQAQLIAGAESLPPELREDAAGIVRSSDEMRAVIEVLMTAARAEADGERGSADVSAAARAALDAARSAAGERGVEMALDGADRGTRAMAEPELVERMLAPLLENAARHARSRVTVAVGRRAQWTEIVVEDDGPGVPAGEELTIFEPGNRGRGGEDGHAGAGLGLALARRLARSAGGELVADPSAAGGRFVVRLPGVGSS